MRDDLKWLHCESVNGEAVNSQAGCGDSELHDSAL